MPTATPTDAWEDASLGARLVAFNTKWRKRQEALHHWAPPPHWGPGLALTPEIRARYEQYIPLQDYVWDLARVGARALPSPSWLPRMLRSTTPGRPPAEPFPLSIADLWSTLPEGCAGRADIRQEHLLPLLCALADPRRHGTACGRYPEQLEQIRGWLSKRKRTGVRFLDVACGTGAGTREIAKLLVHEIGTRAVSVLGVTTEPLEAWMASTGRRPHLHGGKDRARRRDQHPMNQYVAGDARHCPVRGNFDLIACNGLVGQVFAHTLNDFGDILREFGRISAPDGVVLLANRFHEGTRRPLQHFEQEARRQGWRVNGSPRSLSLSR